MAASLPTKEELDKILKGYDLDPSNMGVAIIISNVEFQNPEHNRVGGEKDAKRVKTMLEKIGYKNKNIHLHENRTKTQMIQIFSDARARLVKKKHSTFALCLMSHGKNNFIMDSEGKHMDLWKEILHPFCDENCLAMAGKPKLVITQFCQGQEHLGALPMVCDNTASIPQETVPEMADVLLLMAAPPNHVALRNREFGSPFIQTFCELCERYYKRMSVPDIMTVAINMVSKGEYIIGDHPDVKKTLPAMWNTLRKKFYLSAQEGKTSAAAAAAAAAEQQTSKIKIQTLPKKQHPEQVTGVTDSIQPKASTLPRFPTSATVPEPFQKQESPVIVEPGYITRYNCTGEIQEHKIEQTANYRITTAAARGGSANKSSRKQGAKGAVVAAEHHLKKGWILGIVVGMKGWNGSMSGGGGGMTVIYRIDKNVDDPIQCAGGGGGAGRTRDGEPGRGRLPRDTGRPGTHGPGQGAGWYGAADNSAECEPGESRDGEWQGGSGSFSGGAGGFGGGGGSSSGGGGGGGYSGGDGGRHGCCGGQGGTSTTTGDNPDFQEGANHEDHGYVILELLQLAKKQ